VGARVVGVGGEGEEESQQEAEREGKPTTHRMRGR